MNRLFRFLPIAIPILLRFLRSPRGQSLVAKIRARLGGSGGTPRP